MNGFTESKPLRLKGKSLEFRTEKKSNNQTLYKYSFLLLIDFLFRRFHCRSNNLSIHCHHSLTHSRAAELAAQDLRSSSKQIAAELPMQTRVISTCVVLPTPPDRPQPAATCTHVRSHRSHARRPTVEISLWLFCGFYPPELKSQTKQAVIKR